MTEMNSNSSILIITNDDIIFEYLSSTFENCTLYSNGSLNGFTIIVLDDYEIDAKTLENISANTKILNISKTNYENFKQLKRPFSLNELYSFIKENIDYGKVLKFKNFKILNGILYSNNLNDSITFGTKELELIEYLYDGEANKISILNDVWNYHENIETRVLENTINKIKNKMKAIGYNDFIVLNNGKYEIDSSYR